MTKNEALEILRREHVCPTHFAAMRLVPKSPYQDTRSPDRYECPKCRNEEQDRANADVKQAIEVLKAEA